MYGAVIHRARTERGLSQLALAEISGIEQPNISAIETGRRMPSAGTFHRLLNACGFELAAVAGERVLACPPPGDDLLAGLSDRKSPRAGGAGADLPMATRVRMLTAALDAAEAIVRAR